MPLSKKRNRERMRALRRKQHDNTISKRDVRALQAAGLDVEEVVGEPESKKVSGRVVNAIIRTLEAKRSRVEWQSGGIKMLHNDIATLTAERDMLLAQLQGDTTAQRLTQLEADAALRDAQENLGTTTLDHKGE